MPWEMSRQGLLKHLVNEAMNTRMETVDAYMQIIPPGSRSGKHRHLAEECLYVLEGRGHDLHQDCDVEITDTFAREIFLRLHLPTMLLILFIFRLCIFRAVRSNSFERWMGVPLVCATSHS